MTKAIKHVVQTVFKNSNILKNFKDLKITHYRNPQKYGLLLEDTLHKFISEITKCKLYREANVKQMYGPTITTIDHLIIYDSKIICMQLKWHKKKIPTFYTKGFINDVNIIQQKEKNYSVIGIYLSQHGLTKGSKSIFENQTIKFISISDTNEFEMINKLLYELKHNFNITVYDDQNDVIMDM